MRLHSSMLNTYRWKYVASWNASVCVIKMYAFIFQNKKVYQGSSDEPVHSGPTTLSSEDLSSYHSVLFLDGNIFYFPSSIRNWYEGSARVHLIKLTFTFRSWSRRMFSSLRSRCTTPLCKESRGTWVYHQMFYLCMQAHHCRVWSLPHKPSLRCSVHFSVFLFIILRPLTFHSGLVLQGRVSNIPLNLEKGSRCLIDRREEVLCLG